jgi:hypothetical protein
VKTRHIIYALVLSLASLAALSPATAAAEEAAPAWKIVAATGPTNLSPTQSEVQRLTVQAEGGTFTLTRKGAEGEGTPVAVTSGLGLSVTTGNSTASILAGSFEVGERVAAPGTIPDDAIVLSCGAGNCGVGSTLELSKPATATNSHLVAKAFKPEMSGVSLKAGTGGLYVGDKLTGKGIVPETLITSIEGTTLKLSKPSSAEYTLGAVSFAAPETTGAIPYGTGAEALEEALEKLPVAESADTFTVTGGPGGGAGTPFFIAYGANLANQDIEPLTITESLSGSAHYAQIFTTVPGGAGTGEIGIFATDVGGAAAAVGAEVQLGPLPPGVEISGTPKPNTAWTCTNSATEERCTSTEAFGALEGAATIAVPVKVTAPIPFEASTEVKISGGGASPDSYSFPIVVSGEEAQPGAAAFWAGAFEPNGAPAHQAGSHPSSALTYFVLNTARGPSGQIAPVGLAKDIYVDVPPGFVGNPMVTERCPQSEISCALELEQAKVGTLTTSTGFGREGIFLTTAFSNDVPAYGAAAQFTTVIVSPTQTLLGSVRSEEDFGIRIFAPHAASTIEKLFKSYAVLEGFPAGAHGKPFLTLQSDCAEEARKQAEVKVKFDTWQKPGEFVTPEPYPQPPVTGCDKLSFEPGFTFQPTTTKGSSPVGAEAHLHIDQSGLTDPEKLAPPDLKKSVVKLPAGLSLNPSSANGLEACSEAQIGLKTTTGELPNPIRFSNAPVSCPDGSKLGTVEAVSPLLEEPIGGTIYLARQEENPFGSLLAIYLAIESPRFGLTIKLPGRLDADPQTGRLTATFDYSPQEPIEDLTLHFRGGGPQSELATPEVCGAYSTNGEWEPWSAPQSGPPAQTSDSFTVSDNCAGSASTRPFSPAFEAGTTGTQAGAYSPLVIKVNRKDGEQEVASLDFTLPKGLTGKLAGIPYCSDAAIVSAEHKTGKEEQASASCPATSQIGTVDTSAGVGSEPFHVGGGVYLAGPYKGAPVSSVVITPAVAGPFDLGNVVVRAPLYLDHETAQLTAKSDPLPTILRGIPLKLRSVIVKIDRSAFILNPTDCEAMTASASIGGSSGATATPSNRFQVGGCENLKFAPKLQVKLKGGTRRNSKPALTAILTQAPGQANIDFTSVALPHSEFLEQNHIRTVCTRVQFAAEQCPAGSIYGSAEAVTPLLDQPLTGPVYLRSSSHRLPDMVVALKGPPSQPIEVDLDGRIDSLRGGIRTTFETVPDAPVSKFVLRMRGGKKSLIVNSTDICKGSHKSTVRMTGQNGRQHNFLTPLKAQCKQQKKHGKKSKKHKKSGKK